MTDLEKKFHEDMLDTYDSALEFGYRASRFMQLVSTFGGVQAAHQLIARTGNTYGLEELYLNHRLDLSVEALVLKEEYRPLFTDEERRICREVLEGLGYEAGAS